MGQKKLMLTSFLSSKNICMVIFLMVQQNMESICMGNRESFLSPQEISQYYNWAISNPKRNTLIIDPSLLYNPAISRRRLLLK